MRHAQRLQNEVEPRIPPSGGVAFLRPQVPLCLIASRPSAIPSHPRTLGEHLRKRRSELGLTQTEVAEQLGVGGATVSNWEADRLKPGPLRRPAIVAFLGYDALLISSTAPEIVR